MSITLKEILNGKKDYDLKYKSNLDDLLVKVNKLRDAYGKPLVVTSGFRSLEEHLLIYKRKGITDTSKIPMKSRHLVGLAVDIADMNGDIEGLQKWIKENETLMEEIGLYFEDFKYTKTWVHVQIVPPASGKRFFIP